MFGKKGMVIVVLLLLLVAATDTFAQGKTQVIQLSGLVLGEDSTSALMGANVFVPNAGRGTSTNIYGYFSIPVLPGDSVIFSYVGYRRQIYEVPERPDGTSLTVIVDLQTDSTYMRPIEIFPYPTEEVFKEAILALELPDQRSYDNMQDNLNAEILARIFEATPMNGSENAKYYYQQEFNYMRQRNGPRTNPLLNPLNWAKFIKSIKRGDFNSRK
jgi:hypothetical protein